jgi:hypothetical protein
MIVGAVAGTILNVPPCGHMSMAFSFKIGGTPPWYEPGLGMERKSACPKMQR